MDDAIRSNDISLHDIGSINHDTAILDAYGNRVTIYCRNVACSNICCHYFGCNYMVGENLSELFLVLWLQQSFNCSLRESSKGLIN